MDFGLSKLNSFLSSNPALAQLANNAVSNLTSSPKPAPTLQTVAPAVTAVSVPSAGMSKGMMIAVGAAVVGVAVIMIVIFKRR